MLKISSLIIISAGILLAGCSKSKSTPPPATPTPTPSAPSQAISLSTDSAPVPPPPTATVSTSPDAPAPVANPVVQTELKPSDLDDISNAVATYLADKQLTLRDVSPADLPKMVAQGYLKTLPVPPAGKKIVWDNKLQVKVVDK